MCIWMLSIKLSHFEKITWILVYDGCLFLVKIVSYLILWVMDWWQSHMGLGAHLKRWEEKAKCQKMNENSRRQNPLNLLYFIMILNTIHGPYKAWATRWMLYMTSVTRDLCLQQIYIKDNTNFTIITLIQILVWRQSNGLTNHVILNL
jgi:hypothetical protein